MLPRSKGGKPLCPASKTSYGSSPTAKRSSRSLATQGPTHYEATMKKPLITVDNLLQQATVFAKAECTYSEPTLYGVTDGKAVGTYLEHKFKAHLKTMFDVQLGSTAKGIDFPGLGVDLKVTSVRQPQSSCPFRSARQKVFARWSAMGQTKKTSYPT